MGWRGRHTSNTTPKMLRRRPIETFDTTTLDTNSISPRDDMHQPCTTSAAEIALCGVMLAVFGAFPE